MAFVISLRSKDPSTRHGSVIVDSNRRVVSTGYNGFPTLMNDNNYSWKKEDKHQYVIHSELNAILNATKDLTGCDLYLYSEKDYLPCSNCASVIAQKGIKSVIVNKIKKENTSHYNWDISKMILNCSGVSVIELKLDYDFKLLEEFILPDLSHHM